MVDDVVVNAPGSVVVKSKADVKDWYASWATACPDGVAGAACVSQVTKGVRRQRGVASQNRKAALSTADIVAIVDGLDDTRLIDVRDRALLLLGFATAMRRSELVGLEVSDIDDHPEGLLINLRRSKTDQEAAGRMVEVAYGEHVATCPVRAYRTWLDEAAIVSGAVFRNVDRHGNLADTALAGNSVARIHQTPRHQDR